MLLNKINPMLNTISLLLFISISLSCLFAEHSLKIWNFNDPSDLPSSITFTIRSGEIIGSEIDENIFIAIYGKNQKPDYFSKSIDSYKGLFSYKAKDFIYDAGNRVNINKLTINLDIKGPANYNEHIRNPELIEKIFVLESKCTINDKYEAGIVFSVKPDEIIIKSINYADNFLSGEVLCSCVDRSCAPDDVQSQDIQELVFVNTFDKPIKDIKVFSECNSGGQVNLTDRIKQSMEICAPGEECVVIIPKDKWKKLFYEFVYKGLQRKMREGKLFVINNPKRNIEVGMGNLSEQFVVLDNNFDYNSPISYSYTLSGGIYPSDNKKISRKDNGFNISDASKVRNLLIDGYPSKVIKTKDDFVAKKASSSRLFIIDLNVIGKTYDKKKNAGFYDLVNSLYIELAKEKYPTSFFYKFLNPRPTQDAFQDLGIKNISHNIDINDDGKVDYDSPVSSTTFKDFGDFIRAKEERQKTMSKGAFSKYYWTFEPIADSREITNVGFGMIGSEKMSTTQYLAFLYQNLDNDEIFNLFKDKEIYYISYKKDEETIKRVKAKTDFNIKYISLFDSSSEENDEKQVISLEKLLELID